jgi:hypothetical protein
LQPFLRETIALEPRLLYGFRDDDLAILLHGRRDSRGETLQLARNFVTEAARSVPKGFVKVFFQRHS